MTEGGRKRKSKWDLKEETLLPYEIRQEDASHGNEGESIKDKESKSGWNSTEVASSDGPKWSDMEANNIMKSKANSGWSCWEPLAEKKSAQKDDNINRDCNEILETTTAWARDKSYSTSMSPGVDAWRHQNRSHSPKSGWSRSSRSRTRSRSPPRCFKRESEGWSDINRNGSGVSDRPCKDFSAGRCRRGIQCRFLHHNRNYDNRRHSENGPAEIRDSRHERGGASRYAKTEEPKDYRRDKISHGIGNHYEGNWEMHGTPRNSRSTAGCNDFLKGKCYRGSSCKYVHHAASADEHGGSTKEVTRERAHDRRDKNASFEYDHKREYNMTGSTPCKYFAAGNCRNGEYCRFSHAGPAHASPDKSKDDRWGHNLDNENKPWGGSKWDDTSSILDITKSSGWSDNKFGKVSIPKPMATERSMDDNENIKWGGPTWSNKAAEGYGYESTQCRIEDNDAGMGVPDSVSTGKLLDGTDIHSAEANKERYPHIDKEEPGHIPQDSQSQTLNQIYLSNSESAGTGKLLDGTDIHSAEANKERYPQHIDKEEPGRMPHDSQSETLNEISLPLREKNLTHEISDQQQHSAAVVLPMVSENSYIQHDPSLRGDAAAAFRCEDYNAIRNSARSHNEVNFSANVLPMVSVPGQSFNQNGHISGAQPLSSFNIIGHSQQILPPNTPSGHNFDLNGQVPSNQTLFHRGEIIKRPDMVDAKMSQVTPGTPLTQNIVTSEQVAQITNLSASLSQIFGKGQHLPQLYAALNPPSATGLVPSLPISTGLVSAVSVASIQPNPATWSEKQYDTIGDSIESHKPDINNHPPSSNPVEQKHAAAADPQLPCKQFSPSSVSGGPTGGNPYKSGSSGEELHHDSDKFKQLEAVENSEAKGNNDGVVESKKEQENGHSQNTDPDVRVDEGNKSKDGKEMRTFKFALVEFVKEILKPTWREGQMSKEAHKTIVKKVVDKVTGAIQGAHIPQTQEKIDHYLSYSKPKLTKLVQAYVEKYLKI